MRTRPDEDHDLLCLLTTEELELKSQQLAEVVKKAEQLQADKKAAAEVFKAREEEIRKASGRLSDEILTHKERRAVICRWDVEGVGRKGSALEEWVLRRGDTHDIVQRAPVTAADRQGDLYPSGGVN